MTWTAANKCSACGNSFKTVGKAFQVKLVERMPRVCKTVIKAKGGYLKYILICWTLLVTP
jgi:hypothetical protein